MKLNFLPIVGRELRVAARRRATHFTRLAAASVAMCVLGWVGITAGSSSRPGQLAQGIFYTLSALIFAYCLMAGVRNTADCISEERREGTLGLLLLTDLKGYDVVFGKLAASSLNTVYNVLATLPVLAIPLLMGGLTREEFLQMGLLLLNTLFFSLSVGMWISSHTHDERRAMGGAFLAIISITIVLPIVYGIWDEYSQEWGTDPPGWLLWPSPGFTISRLYNRFVFAGGVDMAFWGSLATVHALGWIFFLLACHVLPRNWQDKPASATRELWRERWKQWCYGDSDVRVQYRHQLLNLHAFAWLACRNRLKRAFIWAFLAGVACFWAWGALKVGRDWFSEPTYIVTALLVHSILKQWIAAEACHRIADDRQSGALELLLATPLSDREIIRGQWIALYWLFLKPLLVVLAVDLCFLLASSKETRTLWLAGISMLVFDAFTLGWVGMWRAMRERRANKAFSSTSWRILTLPWVLYLAFTTLVGITGLFSALGMRDNSFIITWWLIAAAVNIKYLIQARTELFRDFRQAALERYQPTEKSSWWPFK
jgi:ABC-type transport system involved in cytochrome c biogenesis permease component